MQGKQMLTPLLNCASVAPMDERLVETIPAYRVSRDIYAVIKQITTRDRRKISDVARLLLERGVAAYLRDGQLLEPAEERPRLKGRPPANKNPKQAA